MDFITLGIGPGGDIPSFVLVGLSATSALEVPPSSVTVEGLYRPALDVAGVAAVLTVEGVYAPTLDVLGTFFEE